MSEKYVPMTQYRVRQDGDEIMLQINNCDLVQLTGREAAQLVRSLSGCVEGWIEYQGNKDVNQ